jgi:hypothetical protein
MSQGDANTCYITVDSLPSRGCFYMTNGGVIQYG